MAVQYFKRAYLRVYKNTKIQYLANYVTRILLPENQRSVSSRNKSKTSRKRNRKSSSSRGRLNTTFNQFLDATLFVRNTVKNVFIIWALVFGVYILFYFASQAATWQLKSTEQDAAIADSADTSPTPATTKSVETTTLTDNLRSNEKTDLTENRGTPRQTIPNETAVALNVEPNPLASPATIVSATLPAAAADPVTRFAAESNSATTPGPSMTITAYRAVLFDSIDSDNAKQTPLYKDSTVLFIERKGEWIKVITADTQQTGYVHSSHITTD